MSKPNVLDVTDICDPDYSSHYNHTDSNENSENEIEDNTDDVNLLINGKKNEIDSSSDDSQKTDANEQSCNLKNGKKPYNYKPKVKIKTLTIDGQLVYFCKICDKIFTRRKDKLNHELAHSGESMLTCNECGKEYLHESSLASHMRTHDGDPLFMCDLCPKMFAQSHHLKSHILSHSEPTNFVCKTCYMEFATAADLNHHCRIQIKMEMTKLWCKMCKVYFCRNHDRATERRIHAFCCSACNELFYTSKKLKIHMKKFAHYSIEKPKYIEPLQEYELYPDKVSESIRKLQVQKDSEPLKNQDKRDSFDKQQCDVNFEDELPVKRFKLSTRKVFLEDEHSSTSLQDSTSEIKQEIEMKSPTKHRKGKPYCKKCNKSFKDSEDLDRHRALVHEDKHDKSTCGTCKMGFMTKQELDNHSLMHASERLHSCPVCGETFSCSLELTKHLKAHVEDFPYKCSQCGKAFRLKIQLIQHVRLHLAQDAKLTETGTGKNTATTNPEQQGEKQPVQGEGDIFKCHLCSKAFHFRYKLLNHLRLHTNVKCFQCYICHKAFATKHYLQRHLQVHIKQGMDVDVQNIIIDKDSKTELDSVRTQVTRDNSQHKDGGVHRRDKFGCRNHKRKRMGSAESEANHNISRKTDSYEMTEESKVSAYGCDNIKMESQDGSDSGSGNSCCSSLTRDSDRSDPFRFSSDGSNSFKTTMAKERRRLKRRWFRQMKRNRSKLKRAPSCHEQISCPFLVKDKEEDDDGDVDVLDMMVELNGVQSEMDNVMTVFVDLTQMKSAQQPLNSSKLVVGLETTKEELIHGNDNLPELPPLSAAIKLETDWQSDGRLPEMAPSSSFQDGTASGGNDCDAGTGKTLLFEIDAELVENDHFDWQTASTKVPLEKTPTCVDRDIEETTKVSPRKETFFGRPFLESQKGTSPEEAQKSGLQVPGCPKFVSSDLEKLKASFECSSKYLPVSQSSSVPTPSPAQNLQFQKSTSGSNGLDPIVTAAAQVTLKPSMDKKHSHFSPLLPNRHVSVLSMQSDHISDSSKKDVTQNDFDTSQSGLLSTAPSPKLSVQGITKSHTKTTACIAGSSHLSTGSYSSAQGPITKVTSSNVPKVAISHGPTASNTVQVGGGGSFTQSMASKVNVFGSQDCTKPQLNMNTNPVYSSDGNTIPFNNPSSLQNPIKILDPHLTVDHSINQIPKAGLSHSASFTGKTCSTSAVPPANSTYSLGQNGSQVDTPLQINPDQGNFALNISSIFDTNNPVLRNMNMMDLVSPSHSVHSPNLPQASSQPQPHSAHSQNLTVASSQPQLHSAYSQNLSIASSQSQPHSGYLQNISIASSQSQPHSGYAQNLSIASSQSQPHSGYAQNLSIASSQSQPHSGYAQNLSIASSQSQPHSAYAQNLSIASSQSQSHSAYAQNLSISSSQPQMHSAYSQNLSISSSQPQMHSAYSQNLSVASSQPQLYSAYPQNLSLASSQPQHPQGSTLSFLDQNSMEAQMRHSLVTMAELQSASLNPQNTLMNVGNPYLGVHLGYPFQNAFNQGLDVSTVALNNGSLESMVLRMAPSDSTDLNMQLRNMQESAYRESFLGTNIGFIPSLPVNINPYGGALSLNPAINFSSGSGGYGGPATSLGGQAFLNLCGPAVNIHSGVPMSVGSGHHLANITAGFSNGLTPYPLMGLQDSLTNTSAPFGINILNPSMPASGGVMTANPLSMMGNFNTGYFTNFP